jgi:hypothetical protein
MRSHQNEVARSLAIRPIGKPNQFLKRSRANVLTPLSRTLCRHDNVMRSGSARPDLEILPFQKTARRPAQVKRKQMIFDTEEEHFSGRRHALTNCLGKTLLGSFGIQRRHDGVE